MAEAKGTENPIEYHIDLDHSRNPRAYSGKENLWGDDLRRIYKLVENHLERVKNYKEKQDDHDERPLLSIAIFGPSGSGKSSLLRTLAKSVRNGEDDKDSLNVPRERLWTLPVIEPSMWSDDDHFLYAFLATALEEDRERSSKEDDDDYSQILSPVQLEFEKVNEYLRVIDEPEIGQEYDPMGMSLQRLERHTSGLRLRKALSRFITQLARSLKGPDSVVFLPVDDIDLAPDHLVGILKTYQSFLLHPQLVPVFTFTDRMPEELLRIHFEKSSSLKKDGFGRNRRSDEVIVQKRLDLSAQLSVQFLARCFPVRNRIRLGPAPGRVQRALYTPYKGSHGKEKNVDAKKNRRETLQLLTTASFLLFGFPDRSDSHTVRAALRPSTLRRQFQVFDAMADVNVEAFIVGQFEQMAKGEESDLTSLSSLEKKECLEAYTLLGKNLDKVADRKHSWSTVFNGAVWSLLNVHRDTLRELDLYLEDLYSWTPRELRSVVLDVILSQNRVTRRKVVDRWFNRTDYRRSQVLSLLAANAFRPWMQGEEPFGDEQGPLRHRKNREEKGQFGWQKGEGEGSPYDRFSFSATKGFLWFSNLAIGFYLPLIMARDWAAAVSPDEPVKGAMSGNGWDLHNGPLNGARIADAKQELFSFGMMFLDREDFKKKLEEKTRDKEHLLLRIWTCHGYSRGRFWAAVSLWRGLGLMGQVLEASLTWPMMKDKEEGGAERKEERKKKKLVRGLIRAHCMAGMLPGSMLDRHASTDDLKVSFKKWVPLDYWKGIDELAKSLVEWADRFRGEKNVLRIFPIPCEGTRIGWRDCFIRRVHGEYIVGSLWPRLNSAYLESQGCAEERWFASTALGVWTRLLLDYWRGSEPMLKLMLSCPIFVHRSSLGEELKKASEKVEELKKASEKAEELKKASEKAEELKKASEKAEEFKKASEEAEELKKASERVEEEGLGTAFARRWPGIEIGEEGVGFKSSEGGAETLQPRAQAITDPCASTSSSKKKPQSSWTDIFEIRRATRSEFRAKTGSRRGVSVKPKEKMKGSSELADGERK